MPGGLTEQRRGHVLGGAKARCGDRQLAGIGFRGGDQILDVVCREIRSGHDDESGGGDLPDRIECRELVVGHRLPQHRPDGLARGHDAERVAILGGARDRLVAHNAAGAGAVFDHDRLAEFLLHSLRQDAADNVGAAAGPEGDDDADRCLRPFLALSGRGKARRCTQRAAAIVSNFVITAFPYLLVFVMASHTARLVADWHGCRLTVPQTISACGQAVNLTPSDLGQPGRKALAPVVASTSRSIGAR